MKDTHFNIFFRETCTKDNHNPICEYVMKDKSGLYSMLLPSRIFGKDVDEVVVIPKEYYNTIKDSKHTIDASEHPEYIDVRKEARVLKQEIMSAPYKNGYSSDAINHIVRLAQNRQIDAIRVIDYASGCFNLHLVRAASGFCYCIMHIDDNELAEYYLKDIVEDAACIHGGDNANWDCVFMVCAKWRSEWCLRFLNECKEQNKFSTAEEIEYANMLIDELKQEFNKER